MHSDSRATFTLPLFVRVRSVTPHRYDLRGLAAASGVNWTAGVES
jgi:hypothetical protein